MKNYLQKSFEKIWKNVKNSFPEEQKENEDLFLSLENTKIEEIGEDKVIISTVTKIDEVMLNNEFYNKIISKTNEILGQKIKIKFIYKEKYKEIKIKEEITRESEIKFLSNIQNSLEKKFNFENFVVSKENEMLYKASFSIAEQKEKHWNPFFIHGKSGLGKTHLLHSIGNKNKELFKNSKIKYIEAKDFGNIVVNAMNSKNINGEIQKISKEFENYDLLLVDDIQFIQSRKKTKEIFFNIFNHFIKNKKQIVVTSDQNPEELRDFEDRFITRFKSGLLMNVYPPDQKTAKEILMMKIKNNNSLNLNDFEENSLDWLALNFGNNIRFLEGALNRIILFSINKEEDKISLNFVKEIFKDIKTSNKKINSDVIINEVCKNFSITKNDVLGKSRKQEIVIARNISIYLIRDLLNFSLINIGKKFKRDHTTIMNSINKISALLKKESKLKEKVEEIKIKLLRGY